MPPKLNSNHLLDLNVWCKIIQRRCLLQQELALRSESQVLLFVFIAEIALDIWLVMVCLQNSVMWFLCFYSTLRCWIHGLRMHQWRTILRMLLRWNWQLISVICLSYNLSKIESLNYLNKIFNILWRVC